MAAQVTLELSDRVYEFAGRLAAMTGQSVNDILRDTLENIEPEWAVQVDTSQMTDAEVIALADSSMEDELNDYYSTLRERYNAGQITLMEQIEMRLLLLESQFGSLRKSYGLVEAVKRGLRPRGPW